MTLDTLLTKGNLNKRVMVDLSQAHVLGLCQKLLSNSLHDPETPVLIQEIARSCPWVLSVMTAFKESEKEMAAYNACGVTFEEFLNDRGVEASEFKWRWSTSEHG